MASSRDDINLDFDRAARVGLDEAIYCASKSVEQIAEIVRQGRARGHPLLFTRIDQARFDALPETEKIALDYDAVSRTALTGRHAAAVDSPRIAIVCAGTSDVPVAREAERTLDYYGEPCVRYTDVGVAGLWRLLDRIEDIRRHSVVIVAAGMDAALPSVVGGLVPGLVIAVPTSVGYGIAEGGRTALNSALASCSSGVVVVNIDNGFGAACAALRALRGIRAAARPPTSEDAS